MSLRILPFLVKDKLQTVVDQLFKLNLVFQDSFGKDGVIFFDMAVGEILQGFHTAFL